MRVSGTIAAAALIASSFVLAAPATALPLAEVPASPSQWASTPYSPLAPAAIAVPGNSAILEFDGTGGGLHASGDIDTGFTMIQPSSAVNPSAPTVLLDTSYYLPANLSVAGGNLNILATKGIAFEKWASTTPGNTDWKNRQDNTLGVGLNPGTAPIRLQTTILNPAGMHQSAQGGVWFGADDDNYFKVAFMGTNGTASDTVRQVQLKRERVGATSANAADEINININGAVPVGQPITLFLDINPTTLKAVGTYQVGAGTVSTIGTMDVPAEFLNGALLPASAAAIPGVEAFGGIYATKRNTAEATPLTVPFTRFAVNELDITAPAAPGAPTATASVDANALAWTAPADLDIAGYRVYRSATATPVPATAANLISGAALVTTPSFSDTDVFVGQTRNYSVYAVDTSGNVSPAASVAAVTPAPAGTPVVKIDFTTAAGTAQPGYEKDAGAAYGANGPTGWITADDGAAFDFGLNTRIRPAADGVVDPRLLSLIHVQYGMSGGTTNPPNAATGIISEQGVWERELADGRYNVVVAAGDTSAGNFDSSHNVVVEGETAISQFVGTAARAFEQGVVEVEVTDGKLTIAPTDGDNTKLAFVEIYALEIFGADAPTELAAALSEDADAVDLSWTLVEGALGYDVYRSETSPVTASGTPLNAAVLTSGTFTDTTVIPGTTYYYTVVARGDGIPNSAPAAEVSVLVPSAPVLPVAPTGVTAAAGEDDITLTWQPVAGAVGYKVYRGASTPVSIDGAAVSGASALTTTTFVDASAIAGLTYHYVVVALGAEDYTSPASASVSATIEEPVAPGDCTASEWSARYYAGTNLLGAPIGAECFDDVDFSHSQSGSPSEGVRGDSYSARFVKTIDEGAGNYTFTARADDGV
ncbi:hypothetical protein QL996_11330, partial [Planococcus sp. APC 4015]|nr:hypothetical protein [Planococcus sp. APC 4015]